MVVPCDFIGFKNEQYALTDNGQLATDNSISHHEELMTNFFAQPDALAFGKEDSNQHKYFPGNRPSNVFLLNEQGPFEAGMLLALVEHRTAVKGFIWGLNSFDQFGVELGKVLGKDMRDRMKLYIANKNDPKVFEGLNRSTTELFRKFLSH
jgi:glucose-6-phosphate isomerase